MKAYYIAHSGFALETEDKVFIFDYVEGELPDVSPKKHWYVFASHVHGDHFSEKIFQLKQGMDNILFLLSSDIPQEKTEKTLRNHMIFMKPWEKIMVDGMWVETLKSTDEGVAFLLTLPDGQTIYHAGDLNDWIWEEETKEWNEKMEKSYDMILEKLKGRHIHFAFVPVDPRLKTHACDGAEHLLERVKVDRIIPMHCWENYGIIDELKEKTKQMGWEGTVVKMTERGQKLCLDDR